jgi:DNA-binding transcriptional regulator YdaS (Cro superfamily)
MRYRVTAWQLGGRSSRAMSRLHIVTRQVGVPESLITERNEIDSTSAGTKLSKIGGGVGHKEFTVNLDWQYCAATVCSTSTVHVKNATDFSTVHKCTFTIMAVETRA